MADTLSHLVDRVFTERSAQDADRLARFERDAILLASLNHPDITAIHKLHAFHGFEEDCPTPCLVLELVENDTLADTLGRRALRLGLG